VKRVLEDSKAPRESRDLRDIRSIQAGLDRPEWAVKIPLMRLIMNISGLGSLNIPIIFYTLKLAAIMAIFGRNLFRLVEEKPELRDIQVLRGCLDQQDRWVKLVALAPLGTPVIQETLETLESLEKREPVVIRVPPDPPVIPEIPVRREERDLPEEQDLLEKRDLRDRVDLRDERDPPDPVVQQETRDQLARQVLPVTVDLLDRLETLDLLVRVELQVNLDLRDLRAILGTRDPRVRRVPRVEVVRLDLLEKRDLQDRVELLVHLDLRDRRAILGTRDPLVRRVQQVGMDPPAPRDSSDRLGRVDVAAILVPPDPRESKDYPDLQRIRVRRVIPDRLDTPV